MGLTYKQELFCQEYIIDSNATQAAIRAGYSQDTAGAIGHENLKKPDIEARINELQEDRAKRTRITQDRVVLELAKIAFGDISCLFNEDGSLKPIHEIDADTRGAIASIESYEEKEAVEEETFKEGTLRKVKMWDKLKAIEMLGKLQGAFDQKKPEPEIKDLLPLNIVPEGEKIKDLAQSETDISLEKDERYKKRHTEG